MADMHPDDVEIKIGEVLGWQEPPMAPRSISSNQTEDDVIIDFKEMPVDRKEPPLSTSCCIHRVPHAIRKQNREAYTPKVVSIGPFHYGNPRLQKLETLKQIYFTQFIKQTPSSTNLDELASFLNKSARYPEDTKLSNKKFVTVILRDAIFIIKLFLKESFLYHLSKDDAILQNPWFKNSITQDLLLFENQLPFSILEKLFNKSFLRHNQGLPSFLELTFHFFRRYNTQNLKPSNNVRIEHFTDLLRTFHFEPGTAKRKREGFQDSSHRLSYSASELNEAGVQLKVNESKCLLNFKFSKDVLEIPKILVDDSTEILFRNIIAFEQYHYPLESSIIDYLFLLDYLINTSKDVDVLVHNDIIENDLGDSKEVAKLFNGLCKDILRVGIDHDYQDICISLNKFHRDGWNKMKATLRRDYCKTPWQTAASIAAIFLIMLTIVQTICSVIQVV